MKKYPLYKYFEDFTHSQFKSNNLQHTEFSSPCKLAPKVGLVRVLLQKQLFTWKFSSNVKHIFVSFIHPVGVRRAKQVSSCSRNVSPFALAGTPKEGSITK